MDSKQKEIYNASIVLMHGVLSSDKGRITPEVETLCIEYAKTAYDKVLKTTDPEKK